MLVPASQGRFPGKQKTPQGIQQTSRMPKITRAFPRDRSFSRIFPLLILFFS